jgi:hypothetical protein
MEIHGPDSDRTEPLAIYLFDHYGHPCRRGANRLFLDHANHGFRQEPVKVYKCDIFGIGSCNDRADLRVRYGKAVTHSTGVGPSPETAT